MDCDLSILNWWLFYHFETAEFSFTVFVCSQCHINSLAWKWRQVLENRIHLIINFQLFKWKKLNCTAPDLFVSCKGKIYIGIYRSWTWAAILVWWRWSRTRREDFRWSVGMVSRLLQVVVNKDSKRWKLYTLMERKQVSEHLSFGIT